MSELNNISYLLKALNTRPKVFFVEKSFPRLMGFIDGYYICKNDNQLYDENDYQFWKKFDEYVFKKFNCGNTGNNIEQIIVDNYIEEERYDAFFNLFNEFMQKQD